MFFFLHRGFILLLRFFIFFTCCYFILFIFFVTNWTSMFSPLANDSVIFIFWFSKILSISNFFSENFKKLENFLPENPESANTKIWELDLHFPGGHQHQLPTQNLPILRRGSRAATCKIQIII